VQAPLQTGGVADEPQATASIKHPIASQSAARRCRTVTARFTGKLYFATWYPDFLTAFSKSAGLALASS
jgi:hypothetical protein